MILSISLISRSRPTLRLRMNANLLFSSRSRHHSNLAGAVTVSPKHSLKFADHSHGGIYFMHPTNRVILTSIPLPDARHQILCYKKPHVAWSGISCRFGGEDSA
jgi:hypothetical protein